MCTVPEGRGVVFGTKNDKRSQYICRIPLPRRARAITSLCGTSRIKEVFFMFKHPFSSEFWRQSMKSVRQLRVLVMCAICMAASIVLGYFYIPISESLSIRFSYLATASAGLISGPIGALLYGFAVDILDFFMHPGYTYFPGYTLSAMAGAFFYAIFFYRQRITIIRIVLCRLCVNYIVNVGLGALWSSMLYSKGYIYYVSTSLLKNTLMLPVEVFIMYIFFRALLPAFKASRFIPAEQNQKITWF